MPGSWELEKQSSVLCGILHTEMTTMPWSLGFRNLIIPGPIFPIAGRPFDHARNDACMACLDGGFEWLFFLDSDVIPPRDAVPRLIARCHEYKNPIFSGVYFRRSPPVGLPVMMRPVGQWIANYSPGAIVECDVVGAGCLLIHRTVLEKMPAQRPGKHWFDWRVDMKNCPMPVPDMLPLSEDFTFCTWAKHRLGVKTLVDTSVECRHVGLGEARRNDWRAAECLAG